MKSSARICRPALKCLLNCLGTYHQKCLEKHAPSSAVNNGKLQKLAFKLKAWRSRTSNRQNSSERASERCRRHSRAERREAAKRATKENQYRGMARRGLGASAARRRAVPHGLMYVHRLIHVQQYVSIRDDSSPVQLDTIHIDGQVIDS